MLGWKPEVDFRGLVKMMIEHDLELARREKYGRNFRASLSVNQIDPARPPTDQGRSRPRWRLRRSRRAGARRLPGCPPAGLSGRRRPEPGRAARRVRDRELLRPRRPPRLALLAGSLPADSPGSSASCSAATTRRSRRIASRLLPSFDLALRLEARLGDKRPGLEPRTGPRGGPSGSTPNWRGSSIELGPERPARLQRRRLDARRCRSAGGSGIPTILSMVHGDVREEQAGPRRGRRALARVHADLPGRRATSTATSWPGCTSAGSATSSWPIASSSRRSTSPRRFVRHGTPRGKLRVIPYAADCRRFRPLAGKAHDGPAARSSSPGDQPAQGDQVPARSLAANSPPRLAAPAPGSVARRPRPARALPGDGRAPGAGLSRRDARPDGMRPTSSCFPSLFEGSAVVTYEALACGLPSVVTPERRLGRPRRRRGLPRPAAATSTPWPRRMEQLGNDPELRARMAGPPAPAPWRSTGRATTTALVAAVDDLLHDARAIAGRSRCTSSIEGRLSANCDRSCSPVR